MAWAKNDAIHFNSSSGGFCYLLAKTTIEQGGYVIGCVWDADFNAILIVIDKFEDIDKTVGSKYVQSYIADSTWEDIKRRDKAGQNGLVIGLPCQVAAIKSFTRNSGNILFVDLLCRGGCSPTCFQAHLNHLKKKKIIDRVTNVRFRGGKNDCTLTIWDKDKILYRGGQYSDAYFYSFMKHGLLRESCYQCQYAKGERVSDMTIADYQGVDPEFVKDKHVLNGTNLILIHSNKGFDCWDGIKNMFEYYPRPYQEAAEGNSTLREPTPAPSDREQLLQLIKKKGFEKAVWYDKIYRHNVRATLYGRIIGTIRKCLSNLVIKLLKTIIRRS
jgi:coenzyme F420-reducing hydrogenase beta subunit